VSVEATKNKVNNTYKRERIIKIVENNQRRWDRRPTQAFES
jgi:hypothetical protein